MLRVTSIIYPLIEEELKKIPPAILDAKAEQGNIKHKRLENFFLLPKAKQSQFPERSLENMMYKALQILPSYQKAVPEAEVIFDDIMGHPDISVEPWIGDYKFTINRMDTCALQLVGYRYIERARNKRLFMFHVPVDPDIYIYEVNPQAIPALEEFFLSLKKRNERIKSNTFEKLEAIYEWKNLLYSYVLWLPIAVISPDPIANTLAEAKNLCEGVENLLNVEAKVNFVKKEIERFLMDNPEVADIELNNIRYSLQSRKTKQYSIPPGVKAKRAAEKSKYFTEYKESTFLKRLKLAKKLKLIN